MTQIMHALSIDYTFTLQGHENDNFLHEILVIFHEPTILLSGCSRRTEVRIFYTGMFQESKKIHVAHIFSIKIITIRILIEFPRGLIEKMLTVQGDVKIQTHAWFLISKSIYLTELYILQYELIWARKFFAIYSARTKKKYESRRKNSACVGRTGRHKREDNK